MQSLGICEISPVYSGGLHETHILKGLKMTFKSYFMIEIFRQKKEMSSFVL